MPATRGLAELTLDGLAVVFGCFKTAEYGSWIAVTILANSRGGVREASAVLVAQLVPATFVALNVGGLQARYGSRRVLFAGLLTQCCGLAGVAALLVTGAPRLVVYAAAVGAAAAMVTSRPSISALLPSLSPDPRSLTKAHVVLGWLDGASSLLGPAIAAACLLVWSQAASFVVFAVLATCGADRPRRPGSGHRLPRPAGGGRQPDALEVTQSGRVLVEFGPGAGVGELALLLNVPRTATVRAIDAVSTLRLDRDSFLLALTQPPPPGAWETLVRFGLEQGDDAAR